MAEKHFPVTYYPTLREFECFVKIKNAKIRDVKMMKPFHYH